MVTTANFFKKEINRSRYRGSKVCYVTKVAPTITEGLHLLCFSRCFSYVLTHCILTTSILISSPHHWENEAQELNDWERHLLVSRQQSWGWDPGGLSLKFGCYPCSHFHHISLPLPIIQLHAAQGEGNQGR